MSTTVVVELFTTPNKMTKSGKPERWRWRAFEEPSDGPVLAKSRYSFRSEEKALANAYREAYVPDGAVLRSPGQKDVKFR